VTTPSGSGDQQLSDSQQPITTVMKPVIVLRLGANACSGASIPLGVCYLEACTA